MLVGVTGCWLGLTGCWLGLAIRITLSAPTSMTKPQTDQLVVIAEAMVLKIVADMRTDGSLELAAGSILATLAAKYSWLGLDSDHVIT